MAYTIKIELTDEEYQVARTVFESDEVLDEWICNAIRQKVRKQTDRIYEANTGKIAKGRPTSGKIAELMKGWDIQKRKEDDPQPRIKHPKKTK